jgi:two-component system, NarL family, sensor kinase
MQSTLQKLFILLLFLGWLLLCQFHTVTAQLPAAKGPIDSLIRHLPAMMRQDEPKARQMIDALEQHARAQQHRHGIIQGLFFRAWLSYRHDPADFAIAKVDSALKHVLGIQQDTALVNFYILKGQCFVKKTQFAHALEQFRQALAIAKKRQDRGSQTSILISIGWAYMEDGKSAEAIPFFEEVLRLNPAPDYENMALLLCNIAACYNTMGDFPRAERYAQLGIAAARNRSSNADLANGLNILARSLYQQGYLSKAIARLKEAAIVREKVADPSMLAADYLELADLYAKKGQPALALRWAKKAEALSQQGTNALKLAAAYKSLAATYEILGDYKNAVLYMKKFWLQNDSLAERHYNQALAEMQVQFETQKKTAENLQLRKENLETSLRNSQQQRWLLLLGSGLVLLAASGVYMSRLMKSRYRTRLALDQLQEQKRRSMAVMAAEEKERGRLAGDLHDGVGQILAAASLQLQKAKKGLLPLDTVEEVIGSAATAVRRISHQVTPELLLHYGLVKALEQEVDRLNQAGDPTRFSLFTHIEAPLPDEMLSLVLYRCFQELSSNILKHAQARQVAVQLNLHWDEIQLLVEDDGEGFEPGTVSEGLGIRNMKSRVALYDGTLLVDATPGKGTTIIITIPRPVQRLL